MAVGVVMEFAGATLDQYDQVIAKMGFSPGGPGAPGGLFHWVTETADGIRVTDVWESRERLTAHGRYSWARPGRDRHCSSDNDATARPASAVSHRGGAADRGRRR